MNANLNGNSKNDFSSSNKIANSSINVSKNVNQLKESSDLIKKESSNSILKKEKEKVKEVLLTNFINAAFQNYNGLNCAKEYFKTISNLQHNIAILKEENAIYSEQVKNSLAEYNLIPKNSSNNTNKTGNTGFIKKSSTNKSEDVKETTMAKFNGDYIYQKHAPPQLNYMKNNQNNQHNLTKFNDKGGISGISVIEEVTNPFTNNQNIINKSIAPEMNEDLIKEKMINVWNEIVIQAQNDEYDEETLNYLTKMKEKYGFKIEGDEEEEQEEDEYNNQNDDNNYQFRHNEINELDDMEFDYEPDVDIRNY